MKNLFLKKIIGFGAILVFLGVLGSPPARAQDLQAKVMQLEQAGQKNNQDVARAMNLLTQIQRDFQSIKGQVDASKYLEKETNKVYQDLDLRVSSLEDKIDQIHQLLKEMVSSQKAGGPATSSHSQEYADFQTLLAMVNARDYRSAASGFLGFLRKYPKSEYVPKALYWAGECFYFLGDYARSIKEFQKLVDQYPQDKRVAEAVYRQGLAFSRLGKNQEAKLFFQKVMASYPNTATAAKAQSRLHRIQEMEKGQVALGEGSGTEKPEETPEAPPPQAKPQPAYKIQGPGTLPPGAPLPSPGSETAEPPPPPDEGGRGAPTDSSAPLF